MGPVEQQVAVGAVLLVGALVVVTSFALLGMRRRGRRLASELRDSRLRIEELGRRMEELSEQLADRHSPGAEPVPQDSEEYVITSLAAARIGREDEADPRRSALTPDGRTPFLGAVLEERLVGALAGRAHTAGNGLLVGAVVRTVALGHGVRRALSADNLDRALAEAQLARRRSRRRRRHEIRQARRLYRAAEPQP